MAMFLDDDITVSLYGRTAGYHNYKVEYYANDPDNYFGSYKTAFIGRFYTLGGTTSIDITDIVRSYQYKMRLHPKMFNLYNYDQEGPYDLYTEWVVTDLTQGGSMTTWIYSAFKYANGNYEKFVDSFVNDSNVKTLMPVLQSTEYLGRQQVGLNKYDLYKINELPHYPLVLTDNYGIINTMFGSNSNGDEHIYYIGDEPANPVEGSWVEYGNKGCVSSFRSSLNVFLDDIPYQNEDKTIYFTTSDLNRSTIDKYGIRFYNVYVTGDSAVKSSILNAFKDVYGDDYDIINQFIGLLYSGSTEAYIPLDYEAQDIVYSIQRFNQKLTEYGVRINFSYQYEMYVTSSEETTPIRMAIAKLDECPAKYYLMWQDRLGGIQSQGFDGKDTYTEDIEDKLILSYSGHNRSINKTVDQKWTINSKWLTDEQMKIYESIFVSPYLYLYIPEIDKGYNVLIEDKEYTQKTRSNQKKMFNLEITLKLDKKQTMIL